MKNYYMVGNYVMNNRAANDLFKANNVIMIPYAELTGYKSGVNVADQVNRREIYLKNCCVACLSARSKNDNSTDVALVTNIDLPEEYKKLLSENGVKIFIEQFDLFNFSDDYTWALAFYKLCALYKIVRKTEYDNYAYLDSDVFVQNSFDGIWEECRENILLYDINHGLQVSHYRHFLKEVDDYLGQNNYITHFGGEFFAADRKNAALFSDNCLELFSDMKRKNFVTTHGDEFILSLVAARMRDKVKNAGAYIFRFWTGEFRLVSTCYVSNEVTVLHVPDEKESGMIELFDRYLSKGKPIDRKRVYRLLHLDRRSVKITLEIIKQKIMRRR